MSIFPVPSVALTFRVLFASILLLPGWLSFGASASIAEASGLPADISPLAAVDAIVLTDSRSQAEIDAFAAQVADLGGSVVTTFPNTALFARLTAAQADAAGRLPGVRLVQRLGDSHAPLATDLAAGDPGAQAAIAAWNARLAPPSTASLESLPALPDNDVLIAPDRRPGAVNAPAIPGPQATSEYMLGSIQVDVFLLESNGAFDPSTENWTAAQINNVIAEVVSGINWWVDAATQNGQPSAHITTNIEFHTPLNQPGIVATAFEPINRSSEDQSLWINEVMGRLGYSGASTMDNVGRYVHARRTAAGRDWGFVVWVINSAVDPNGKFNNGKFAFSYLYGPYFVMTYDNNGWGISLMEIVAAHEMGHIFGALDEYAASGCMDAEKSGYLQIANTNCENGTPATQNSIMRDADSQVVAYPLHMASTPVRQMVGFRDSDGDGFYDPIDTLTGMTLNRIPPDPADPFTLSWTGLAEDIPWPSPSVQPISLNYVANVAYQIDGSGWTPCAAGDGAFDGSGESFTCSPTTLTSGWHSVEVQALGRFGNQSAVLSDQVGVSMETYSLYLPLVVHQVATPGVMLNGNFESGRLVGWQEFSTHDWPLAVNTGLPQGVTPHSGSWLAWLGGAGDDTSRLYQSIVVPSENPSLSFWYWIASADVCGFDTAAVLIDSAPLQNFDLCNDNDTGGWIRSTLDLSAYAGQSVSLEFQVVTDTEDNSNFFLDDVAFGAPAGAPAPAPAVAPASAERPRR